VGNAPERNLLRRQLKAIFYEEKLFERGFECIIILRKEAVPLSFAQLKELLLDAYRRV
jgi:ribonuclease P protein component